MVVMMSMKPYHQRIFLILLVLLIQQRYGYTQNLEFDSTFLKKINETNFQELQRHHENLLLVADHYTLLKSIKNIDKRIEVTKQNKSRRAFRHAHLTKAWIYHNHGKVLNAYETFQQGIALSRDARDSIILAKFYHDLGLFQAKNYLYSDAIKNISIAIDIAGNINDYENYQQYIRSISDIYYATNELEEHKNVLKKLIRVENFGDVKKNRFSIMYIANNIGLLNKFIHESDSSLKYFDLSLSYADSIENIVWLAILGGNKAQILITLGRYEESKILLESDIKTSIEHEQWGSAINASIALSGIHSIQKNFDLAKKNLDKAYQLYQLHNNGNVPSKYWRALTDYYLAKGNYKEAFLHEQFYADTRVKELRKEQIINNQKFEKAFSLELKQNEVAKLHETVNAKSKTIQRQQIALTIALFAVSSFLLVTINFIYNYVKQRKLHKIIRQHQYETMLANHELRKSLLELQQTQDQLIQTEKMAFLGRITSNIAHEINTPLGAIKASTNNLQNHIRKVRKQFLVLLNRIPNGATSLLLSLIETFSENEEQSYHNFRERKNNCIRNLQQHHIPESHILAEYLCKLGIDANCNNILPLLKLSNAVEIFRLLNELHMINIQNKNITHSIHKANKILFALKTYSYPTNNNITTPVNIVQNIEMVLSIYSLNLHQIEVIKKFEELPVIHGYPEELNQIWTNVIHNSIQAMHGKGKLTLLAQKSNEEIMIEVSDTGDGISEEHKDKLFDPLFTTKPVGEGTGLGLSIVKKIIEKHQGRIELESEVNRGTSFRFFFPIDHTYATEQKIREIT
jgi:signal transduction histidine kinase